MDIVTLNRDIQNKDLKSLYILTGPEIGLQNIYIKQILKQRPGVRKESVESITSKLKTTTSLFSQCVDTTYIIRDDLEVVKNEKSWDILNEIDGHVTLILLYTDLNKKSKFYKKYKGNVIEFEKMTTQQLYNVVHNQLNGTKSMINYFIESCDNDYTTILNNIDKFKRCGLEKLDKNNIDKIVHRIEPGDVFKLLDYVIAQDTKAINELNNLLASGCSELMIMSMLANRIQQVIIIIGYADKPNIDEYTGINKWVCKNILKINRIAPNGLLQALRIIKQYDNYIKTGVLNPKVAVMSCVLKILCI